MKDYRQIQARLTPEEKEGMARIVEAVRLKRIEAAGMNESFTLLVQPELRDEEEHRTAQE